MLVFNENVHCDPSLEPSQRDSTNYGSQLLVFFYLETGKMYPPISLLPLIWSTELCTSAGQRPLIQYKAESLHPQCCGINSNVIWSRGYKRIFMLNSAEHEILNAHKYKNIVKFSILQAQISLECYFSCT